MQETNQFFFLFFFPSFESRTPMIPLSWETIGVETGDRERQKLNWQAEYR